MMPGQFHKRRWFFASINADRFRFVGCRYYGLVWGHYWPLLAVAVDDSWYEPTTSYSVCCGPLEAGFFIEYKSYGQVRNTPDTEGKQS